MALTSVRRARPCAEVVQRLLRQAAKAGVRPRYLLLDRGFCSVAVIRYLQAARYAFLMPVPLRGRKADHPEGPGGTRVFAPGKRSGWGRYTLTDADRRKATVSICVKCRNRRGERGKHGRQALVYAYGGGLAAVVVPVGEGDVPEPVRDRDELPAVAAGADPDVHARPAAAAAVRGGGVGAAQRVGVAALGGVGAPARGGRRVDLDRLPFRADAAVAATPAPRRCWACATR